jgi:alanine dehydrogenase
LTTTAWSKVTQLEETKVGISAEVKNHEYRVAITPAGVRELTSHGHEVFSYSRAGASSSSP